MEHLARRVQAGEALIQLSDELTQLKSADQHALVSLDDARYGELMMRLQRLEDRGVAEGNSERLVARIASLEELVEQTHARAGQEHVARLDQRQREVEQRLSTVDSTWQQHQGELRRESMARLTALDESRQQLQQKVDSVAARTQQLSQTHLEQLMQAVQSMQARCEAMCADVQRDSSTRVEQLRSDCRTSVDALASDVVVVKHSISGLTRLLNKTVTSLRRRASPSPTGRGAAPPALAADFDGDSELSEQQTQPAAAVRSTARARPADDIAMFLQSLGTR